MGLLGHAGIATWARYLLDLRTQVCLALVMLSELYALPLPLLCPRSWNTTAAEHSLMAVSDTLQLLSRR